MDLQTFVDNQLAASRAKTLAESDQLTLGELILKLEPICEKQKDDEEACVFFDFAGTFPVSLHSWRGIYKELALSWGGGTYTSKDEPMKISAFLKMLKDAIGKEFTGWKGGEFKMHKGTPIWVDDSGCCNNTAVIEVVDDGWRVILMTGYRES